MAGVVSVRKETKLCMRVLINQRNKKKADAEKIQQELF
jgi:hypothetical protein